VCVVHAITDATLSRVNRQGPGMPAADGCEEVLNLNPAVKKAIILLLY
jgi:hypothetical protein